MGVFYLIDNDGSLVAEGQEGKDYLDDVNGIRDLINPDFNLEMVFLSSYWGSDADLPQRIADDGPPDYAYEESLYLNNRTIDVITIPEITAPYTDFSNLGGRDNEPELE